MASNRLEEIRERVDKEMMRCQTHRYVKANEPGYGKEPVCQDIPYLLERLRLAEAVVGSVMMFKTDFVRLDRSPEASVGWLKALDALTAHDAFLSASNPEAGGGK